MGLKETIKKRFPGVVSSYHWLRLLPQRIILRVSPRDAVFTRRYHQGGWQGEESVSGWGSSEKQTREVRAALPGIVQETGAKTFLDIPCGDLNWMQQLDLGVERYIGADIVDGIIAENRRLHGGDRREFVKLDLVSDDLPEADIVFCRDCLVHLSSSDIFGAIRNIKRSGSRYLLTTTHVDCTENREILTGEWRPINFEKPPFNFPPPEKLVDEKCAELGGPYTDKYLGLWKVADLPG